MQRFKASRFNFHIPATEETLLFNAGSGALLALSGHDGAFLARLLSSPQGAAPDNLELEAAIPEAALADLLVGKYLVPLDFDEVAEVQKRYWLAREQTPVVLTLTTTMDCNLGCYYCYETRTRDALALHDVGAIVALAANRIKARQRNRLHVDWYGGEPLLNVEFLEAASAGLQNYCRGAAVKYTASVISNGTKWPEDVGAFITRHCITQVQISFDGLKANHNQRRRYRDEYKSTPVASSFDNAADLVDQLVRHVRVDVRLNIDRANQCDVLPFVRFARERGWFSARYPITLQPARLASYSEKSSFLRKSEISVEQYNRIRESIRIEADGRVSVEESEAPEGFPYPRTSVCAALAFDSAVVGADRKIYRCGLQVGESQRSVGELTSNGLRKSLPILGQDDNQWWEQFDPTCQPRCSHCSFLPICWAGCPKKHLEGDIHAIYEQGEYWRMNLARLVANYAKKTMLSSFFYTEADQFRLGLPIVNAQNHLDHDTLNGGRQNCLRRLGKACDHDDEE